MTAEQAERLIAAIERLAKAEEEGNAARKADFERVSGIYASMVAGMTAGKPQ